MGKLTCLRVVIQQIGRNEWRSFRLVAYGDEFKPRHADFTSAQNLRAAFLAAIPEFDLSLLSLNPQEEGHGSILFEEEICLDDDQVFKLGLS